MERRSLKIDLTSEIALREFLIAPVLGKLIDLIDVRIRPEFFLEVNHQLKGTLDYFVKSKIGFIVIEAKNGELSRGFTTACS